VQADKVRAPAPDLAVELSVVELHIVCTRLSTLGIAASTRLPYVQCAAFTW
jgi:hypothetical protein